LRTEVSFPVKVIAARAPNATCESHQSTNSRSNCDVRPAINSLLQSRNTCQFLLASSASPMSLAKAAGAQTLNCAVPSLSEGHVCRGGHDSGTRLFSYLDMMHE
jgi:hypothetical protein